MGEEDREINTLGHWSLDTGGMVSRRKILSRSRDDLTLEDDGGRGGGKHQRVSLKM